MGWARSGEGQMGEARDKVDRKKGGDRHMGGARGTVGREKGGEDQKWGETEVDSTIWVGSDWRRPYW